MRRPAVIFDVVLHTMMIFFAILSVGFVTGRLGVIKKDFTPGFARLITKVLLPCLIFYATVTGCTREAMADNLPMLGLAAGFYTLIICITFVESAIKSYRPDIIIVNAGGASVEGNRLIMHEEDVLEVHCIDPSATIVASHLDAVDHAVVTRESIKRFAAEHTLVNRIVVPEDGETLAFESD